MIKLSKKNIKNLKKYASASIIEQTDGTYMMSPTDTSAIYLTILALNKQSISVLPIEEFEGYNISNQSGDFYQFKTSMFNDFIDKYQKEGFKFADNIKQGQAGNIARSFLSVSHNKKIINQDMFNIIDKSKIKIILNKDHENYLLEINNLDDWNNFINDTINGYKPIRLVIENVSFPECNNFYLKKINAYIEKVYGDILKSFIKLNDLKKMKSKQIRETYGFDLTDYISGISNQNFLVKDGNGILKKIYLIEKYYLYLPYEEDDIRNYDQYSFIKNKYSLKKENDIFEFIDILESYSIQNKNEKVDDLTFFVRKESKNIRDITISSIKQSSEVLLNNNDDNYIKELSNLDGIVFDIYRSQNSKNVNVKIRNKKKSNINVTLYDRAFNKYDNSKNQLSWFEAINSGLSFEREKTLSVFFIEKLVSDLIDKGHENINIQLERPVRKKDNSNGFLDLFITSEINGFIHGQVFEFKAIYSYTDKVKEECVEQAESYNITHLIDENNIESSYGNYDHNEVTLLNLI